MKNKLLAAAVFGLVAFFAVSCANEAEITDVLGGDTKSKTKKVQPESQGVRLTPSTVLLYATETQAFTATLTGNAENAEGTDGTDGNGSDPLEAVDGEGEGGAVDQGAAEYEWSITMKTDTKGTTVTEDGVVTLGEHEAGPVVVKAVSKQNSEFWGTAVITIKSGKPPRPPEVYTVSFDITDGTSGKIESVQVGEGDSVASVVGEDWEDPTNTNDAGAGNVFYFDSWNTQADESGSPWAISDPVTSNLKVYAIWKVLAADKAVVRFDTNRQTVDIAPQTVLITKGTSLAAAGKVLPNPKSGSSDFAGWFQDKDVMAIAFNENSIVNDSQKTVYAKWTAKRFTIEYDSNGGSTIPSETVEVNTHLIDLPTPVKGTSIFEGWYKDNGSFALPWQNSDLVTSDVMLYAKWRDLYSYTVTFHTNGGNDVASRTIESGSKLTSPTDPTKGGWTFGGWFTDDKTFAKEWDFNTKITKDEDLYARWFDSNANLRTVTYNTNGAKEQITARTVELYSLLTNPQDPEKDGFRFVGWYSDDETFEKLWRFSSDTIQGNMVLHAKWEVIIKYTVSFETNGGKPSIQQRSVGDGDLLEFPASITRGDAVFAGWYADTIFAREWDFKNDTVNEDTTLYAKWTHMVSFNSNGGTSISSIADVSSGAKIIAPNNPSKIGADFYKWYKESSFTNEWNFASDVITENTTLYAKWQHTVTFDSNGGTAIPSQTVFTGSKVTQPAAKPTKDKAVFDKWTKDSSLTEDWNFNTDTIKEHTTIYGRWIQKNIVKFETNGATSAAIADKEITTGDKIPTVTQPTKTNADFGGWYSDEDLTSAWDFDNKVTGPMTLYVKWTHKVTFSAGTNVTAPDAKTVIDGRTVAAPSVSKDGATLDGWYAPSSTTKWNFATDTVTKGTAASPLVLTAKWNTESYLVRFAVDGGSDVANQTVNYGSKATRPTTITKTGYDFVNWYEDASLSSLYDFNKLIVGEIIIYAKWVKKTYTVTFDSKGGSAVTAQTIKYDEYVSEPERPTQSGRGFVAWHSVSDNFTNDTRWSFSVDKVTSNIKLYAQWSIDTYTVHFETDGGTEIDDLHPAHNTSISKPENPTKNGWTFNGKWYVGSTTTEWNFTTNKVTSDITLTAKYTINKYTVRFYKNYNATDTSILATITNVEHGSFVTQANPSRSGYKFEGWSTDASDGDLLNLEGYKITSNQIIYAQWTPIKYTVVFDVGTDPNAYVKPSSVYQAVDTEVTLPTGNNVTRTGYSFLGWYATSSYTGNALTSYKVPINGATLYGKWVIGGYSVTKAVTGKGSIELVVGGTSGPATINYGAAVTVKILPEANYQLKAGTLKYNGTAIELDHTQNDYLTGSFVMPAEDVIITAEFEETEWTIQANRNIVNGTVKAYLSSNQTAEITSAKWGSSVVLKPVPSTGYKLKTNSLTTVKTGTTDTVALTSNAFTMPISNVTVNAVFEKETYTITKNAMTNGSITVAASALFESSVAVSVSPATGYKITSLTYTPADGTATTLTVSNNAASFNMPASGVTINAVFDKETYTITRGTMTNGSVTVVDSSVYNSSISVTVVPATGYKLTANTLKYTPVGGTATTLTVSDNLASFNMPAANVTINASFEKELYTITKADVTNGSMTVSKTNAYYNDSVTVNLSPVAYYELDSLKYTTADGTATTLTVSNNAASFNMPAANITVSVQFKAIANLAIKFDIIASGDPTAAQVTATFNAVHNYVSDSNKFNTTTTNSTSYIKLGDYIDLPSLVVTGDAGGGAINATNTDATAYDTPASRIPHGKLLRLIVVGINSFNDINGNNKSHVVFHFQNTPGTHRMNANMYVTNEYLKSEMRTYIINNFLPGLLNAGVPDSVLWAPNRIVANKGIGTQFEQTITDKLWLPTEHEIFGSGPYSYGPYSVKTIEKADNQASFTEFYKNDSDRRKSRGYFLASPYSASQYFFCLVGGFGYSSYTYADTDSGFAPAFCVW
ncbi:MAG: hypothetical protein Ta2G_00930 [Termitinemataceae bacterium]|nr:MAG: hypothetical protein Ta2G_00930 [Termitinemataceae bacterium]